MPRGRERRDRLGRGALETILFVCAFACFAPALGAEFVNWDDYDNLLRNPEYRGLGPSHLRWMFTTFHLGPYQPLSWVTFGADYLVWGLEPLGYHLTNLLIHALNAVLAFRLFDALLARAGGAAVRSRRRLAAAAGALFFAIHPLRVESVAWVTERRDVLSGAFFLISLLFYVRRFDAGRGEAGERRRRDELLALVAFVLSLLAKAAALALPVALLFLDGYFVGRGRASWRRSLVDKLPYLVASVVFGAVAILGQASAGATAGETPTLGLRLVQAVYGLAFYVQKTLVPLNLSPFYPRPIVWDAAAPRFLAAIAGVSIAAALLFALRRRLPAAAAAFGFYAVLASPVLGLVTVGALLAADRYSYLPGLSLAALLAGALLSWTGGGARASRAVVLGACTLLLALGAACFAQTRVWHDSITLWTHALSVTPDDHVAHFNLGRAMEDEARDEEAIPHYRAALAAVPHHQPSLYNLGRLLLVRGHHGAAIPPLERLASLAPDHAEGLYSLGLAHFHLRHYQESVRAHRASLAARPHFADAEANLGQALWELGRRDEAREAWQRALEIDSRNRTARASLSRARGSRTEDD